MRIVNYTVVRADTPVEMTKRVEQLMAQSADGQYWQPYGPCQAGDHGRLVQTLVVFGEEMK